MTMRSCVESALAEVQTTPADAAAVDLARRYADAIDAGGELDKVGPKLLAVLVELRLTPKSRAALVKGEPDGSAVDPLDELEQRRAARAHGTPAVDAAAP